MNISIPHSWLKDFVETNASVEEIAKSLSLHSFSVEKIEKTADGDHLFEIEVTPNRSDALSVVGIAREMHAVLPLLGFKSKWKEVNVNQLSGVAKNTLKVDIKDKTLVPRFSAVVLDNIKIAPSPTLIAQRLEKVGIRAINNVVDVTNYLMIETGQPMHVFDYDKIVGSQMVVRESREGEKVITLDGVDRNLPKGVIVIEDGSGRLIDLCGIMGGQNTEVTNTTSRVLLFVQVYDAVRIRRASMNLGHRTDAALRFEKGVDFGVVLPVLHLGAQMLCDNAGAQVASEIIDLVNIDYKPKVVDVKYDVINTVAGVEISKEFIDKSLSALGFKIADGRAEVPSYRYDDIDIPEDLAEEVVRLYGYYNLPSKLLVGEIPTRVAEPVFHWEEVAKNYLKFAGFSECYNYSATNLKFAGEGAIALANPLNEDFSYLRTSLVPTLAHQTDRNRGFTDGVSLYELAPVYLSNSRSADGLPLQPLKLTLCSNALNEMQFKGVVEGLFRELGIKEYAKVNYLRLTGSKLAAELDFDELARMASDSKKYTPLTSFNSIKEDLTLVVTPKVTYDRVVEVIKSVDNRIEKLSYKDFYVDSLTLSIEYLDRNKQISSEDTREIRKNIFETVKHQLGLGFKV